MITDEMVNAGAPRGKWWRLGGGSAASQDEPDATLQKAIYSAFRNIDMGVCSGMPYIAEQSVTDLSEALSTAIAAEIERALSAIETAPATGEVERLSRTPSTHVLVTAEEIDDLVDRLLDAQQDVNLSANETMSQPLCDASALIDEVEKMLLRIRAALTTATDGKSDD